MRLNRFAVHCLLVLLLGFTQHGGMLHALGHLFPVATAPVEAGGDDSGSSDSAHCHQCSSFGQLGLGLMAQLPSAPMRVSPVLIPHQPPVADLRLRIQLAFHSRAPPVLS